MMKTKIEILEGGQGTREIMANRIPLLSARRSIGGCKKVEGQKVVNSMAAKAFILIETVVGGNKEVVAALKQLEGVKSVDTVTGPYDVIATYRRRNPQRYRQLSHR